MYSIHVTVQGVAPLLQHRFGTNQTMALSRSSKKVTGKTDYSDEWKDSMYVTADGELYQPGEHFVGALIKASANYKVPGRRGKTYRDLFKSAVFIRPDAIPHNLKAPDSLPINAFTEPIYIDVRPVVVQRARVMRARLAFSAGWKLSFDIDVIDDQLPSDVVNEVLIEAGQKVGIGDYRPRLGRFMVTEFNSL